MTPAIRFAALEALNLLNAPRDEFEEQRIELVARHLAEVDGRVVVVDAQGTPRTKPAASGPGVVPFTVVELVRELLVRKDAGILRWHAAQTTGAV